jgi:hypothetical protein
MAQIEVFHAVSVNGVALTVIAAYCMVIALASVLYLSLLPLMIAIGSWTSVD